MNALGRLALNNPARALAQRRYVLPELARIGGRLDGCRVLEVGCGRGVGTLLLLDLLGAASVDAIDVDPVMVELATGRVATRARVHLGDITAVDVINTVDTIDTVGAGTIHPGSWSAGAFDAVVDLGALHLEPDWRGALATIHRLLVPGGRFCFEEIVRPVHQSLVPLATGHRIAGRFARTALLDELDSLGFEIVGLTNPRAAVLTGMVGDLLGVARKLR